MQTITVNNFRTDCGTLGQSGSLGYCCVCGSCECYGSSGSCDPCDPCPCDCPDEDDECPEVEDEDEEEGGCCENEEEEEEEEEEECCEDDECRGEDDEEEEDECCEEYGACTDEFCDVSSTPVRYHNGQIRMTVRDIASALVSDEKEFLVAFFLGAMC